MEPKYFALENREQVERFERLLAEYSKARAQIALEHIPLAKAFDELHKRPDGGRIFTALLDLYLNFHLIDYDMTTVGGTWNNLFSNGKLEGGSILDTQAKFFGKMDIHRYASSFVLRYRAVWDKLMGFLILYFAPEEYESFANSKSKKKSFRRIAAEIDALPQDYVNKILDFIEKFDNTFRTPEAHGTGSVRKWSLTMESFKDNPLIDLIGYWNIVNHTMLVIGGIFDPSKSPKPAHAKDTL